MNKLLILTCAAVIGIAASASAATIDLSTVTTDTDICDGDTVTGMLGQDVKLSIRPGATVTLSDVTNILGSSSCKWAGLTCEGNATIILQGNNRVKGFNEYYPGIYVPVGHTLTIKGTGSLYADSNGNAAGIGGGYGIDCGNIVIESGTITARGDEDSAGIGGGLNARVGSIIISGGTITANGGEYAAGIGSGKSGSVNNILISGGSITATAAGLGLHYPGVGIGGGYDAQCGGVFISGGTIIANGGLNCPGIGSGGQGDCGVISISGGDVTATAVGEYAAGIGSANNGSCGPIYIKSGITRVVAHAADVGDPPIGAGGNGTCGAVVVDDSLDDTTSGLTRTITSDVANLANITEATTVADGKIITGTLAANVKLSIADGATVTLRDVTINGVDDTDYAWAGITCLGDATIILEGSNTVRGFYEEYPGIYVPEGSTLTIKGDGSLAASSGYGAGIGGGYSLSCGNIRIEGGTITATGGSGAAGIGGGYGADCGDITITKGVTSVTATNGGITPGHISIGRGDNGTCGTVTIGGVVTGNIAESPYTYAPTRVNLAAQSGNYTAADGEVLYGETVHTVTVPSGANVMINGVEVAGGEGGTVLPMPAFSAGGKAVTTEFVQGANGKWTLTTFAELANDALGADVTNAQIKVYAASTVEGLESASPMASGVEVKEKKSAVKTTIEVTPPSGASQFFKVKFGE